MKFGVAFGGRCYEVKQLPALQSREWRHRLIESTRSICDVLFKQTNGHDEHFFAGLAAAYLTFPDKMLEMIFAYDPALPEEEIRRTATDDDIIATFTEIMRRAYPYLNILSLMTTVDLATRLNQASTTNLDTAVNHSEKLRHEPMQATEAH